MPIKLHHPDSNAEIEEALDSHEDLWVDLEKRASLAQQTDQDLWQNLRDRLDLFRLKPKASSAVEVCKQTFREKEYFVLNNTEKDTYLRLDDKGLFLWNLMDGKHSLTDLMLAYLLQYGVAPIDLLTNLLSLLQSNSLLDDGEDAPSLYGLLLNKINSKTIRCKLTTILKRFSQAEISIDADHYFGWIYHHGGWLFYTKAAILLLIIISILGSILFLKDFLNPRLGLSIFEMPGLAGIFFLILLNLVIVFFHESGHGLTVKALGRKVINGGFLIYYGEPCFYVDTTDMWLGTRNQRIVVSWAGPFVNILIASICSIIIAVFPSSDYVLLLYKASVLSMFAGILNLNPLLEWDGYYMLMNYLEIPNLRNKSFDFMRTQLVQRLFRGPREFSKEEKIYTIFGIVAGIWTVLSLAMLPYVWTTTISPEVGPFWASQGIGVKIFIIAAGVLWVLTVVGSVVAKIWSGVQQIRNAIKKDKGG